ncbi:MAG: TraB/GumN family protein, partial [Pseudomonadota bacterium]
SSKAHFGVMDAFSREEQLVMLRAVLKRTQAQKEADFERLISAYLDGDSDKISALDEKITGAMLPKEIWDKMRVKLLDERNVLMAERSIQVANQKPVFVAVGASHLAGETGLINAFKKAGFKLTKVEK